MRAALVAFMVLLVTASAAAAPKELSESQAYKAAEGVLLDYFQNEFMKTQAFEDTFGTVTWEEIAPGIIDGLDITRDRRMESGKFNNSVFAFTGRIFDLYTEVTIDRVTGARKSVLIEYD